MEFSHAEKQKYLRHAIIEQQYDAESFATFLGQQKPEGDDIENWSLNELKECVEKFKISNKPGELQKRDDSSDEHETTTRSRKTSADDVTLDVYFTIIRH